MWLFIIFVAFVCASVGGNVAANSEDAVFRKCCPKNQGLVKVIDFDSVNYECLNVEEAEEKYNVANLPLFVGDSVNVEPGIPDPCDVLKMEQLETVEVNILKGNSVNTCYDRLIEEVKNGTALNIIPKVVSLTCSFNNIEKHSETKLTINRIRKCCPKGQFYDLTYHSCKRTDQENDEKWLMGKLNLSSHYIYEVENGLNCKYDEFGVELSEELYSLNVEGSNLSVLKRLGNGGGNAQHSEWCVEGELGKPGLMARVCTKDCAAYGAYCMRKCCPIGQHYRARYCGKLIGMCVRNEDDVNFDISTYLDPLRAYGVGEVLGIRTELRCPIGKVMLNRTSERDYTNLTIHGHLMSKIATNDDYCLETYDSTHCPGGDIVTNSIICYIQPPNKNFRISFVLICISSVCLALTLVVYCCLRELRNLHGKTLICHVSMMLLAFSCLARAQYEQVVNLKLCTMLGYGIYFGFMAAFAWLNVMCLDIWRTFGSMRTVQPMRKAGSELKRFLWYSLYAWSVAILLTLTTFLLDKYPIAHFLDSNIGDGMCWFGAEQNGIADWPHYIFFVIPMAVGTCINLILFMLTARHCAQVKSEVHRMQAGSVGDRAKRRFRIDRAKYVLTAKLWVVMGAGWISEILSTIATHPQWLWSIVDLFNELQGVFIFLILVFKPKVYYLIRKRLGLEKPAQKPSSSARTSSTFLSRTISSDERNALRISQTNNIKQS